MFKTKLEVDKHVDNCLKKINNETERNLKSFSFAKLYFSIGDYEHARRYVSSYLNVKPKSAEGFNLLGKCLEKMNKKDAALEAYKNSLELDSKQNNLVIKVCELLSSDDIDMDPSGAKYFCELAQSFDPNNTAVYRLREKLITKQSDDPLEISRLLVKELESRPADVNLRVRLLKHFLQHNMVKDAYKHASAIEEKNSSLFKNQINWYETFSEVLVKFQRDASLRAQINWEFWFLSVSVLDRLVMLSLDEHIENPKTSSEYIAAVFNFDQILTNASQCINSCPDRQLVSIFLNHYYGQLNFHLATLAQKQAKGDLLTFKEVSNLTIPLIFMAYHSSPPDIQSIWFIHTSQSNKQLVQQWHKEAFYRCSQTGHLLLVAAENCKSLLLEKASFYTTGMWREQFFKKVFVKRDHHLNISTSYFVSNSQHVDPIFKLPDPEDVSKYDEVAQLLYPDSLHYYIWIALNNKLSKTDIKSFDGLQYSVKNFNNCAAESLSLMDVQAFLYCATLCVKSNVDEKRNLFYYSRDKPKLLPASITDSLGTIKQSNFFKVAFMMYENQTGASMTETRLLLIKGIETVRCVGNHGLSVELLVKLANIFEERSKKLTKQSEIEYNTARAELYWSHALPLLEKIKNNKLLSYPSDGFFEYKSNEISPSNASKFIEKGKLFTGYHLMRKKEYERALHILEQLRDPYASFYQSQIYKNMADQTTNDSKENVTSEMRSQHIILLSRSRDCLYLTLDRLRDPSVERSHPLNSQLGTEIEKVERLLSRIDPDCINRNECDGMSDENPSSDNSVGEQYVSTYSFVNGQSFSAKHENHNHSTPLRFNIPRQEAKPSPERLDAQIRQIAASRDAAFSTFADQNKLIVESHRNMLEEFKNFKGAINSLTTVVQELNAVKAGLEEIKNIEKSVTEIRNSFDLSNLLDTIQEMRKEINELKRDQNKTNQLSDEDLHFLDPDYAVDYNINSNIGYNPGVPSMYTNYHPGRIQNHNPLNPYPGLYPSIYPGFYGPIGIPPQQSTVAFPTDQNPGASSLAGYPQPILSHVSLASTLSNASLGVGMLTGQSLSQGIGPSPRNLLGEVTNTTQSSVTSVTTALSGLISTSKAPPVNVVITSSDPLPTNVIPTPQPILSVTIPPQHLKGNIPKTQPHNYQIPLPSSNMSQITTTPSVLSKPPPTIKTQSLLSNVAPPVFSAIPQNKEPTKYLSDTPTKIDQTQNSQKDLSLNKSNVSTNSLEEHDPCPDFKPIIPLPDEVPVSTGEEGETQLFCEHAKLFRHVNTNGVKEWKERGVGILKILHNPKTGKFRILMRRDQVHKICANHFVTTEMCLTPMTKNDKAFIWVAHDFADEVVVVETFCVKFKTTEQSKSFQKSFLEAKQLSKSVGEKNKKEDTPANSSSLLKNDNIPKKSVSQDTSLGGFVFMSTPTFQPKEPITSARVPEVQDTPNTPFSNFSFGKTTNLLKTPVATSEAPTFSPLVIAQETSTNKNDEEGDSNAEEFVPNAEFKPVIALPDLVEVKTGEEDMLVLFENRCKLYRFDADSKEWKERGVGNIKILKGEDIRLVMRRDQVHKVCCNHTVLKNMIFSLKDGGEKTIVWTAQDFSEGVLKTETFAARFKTEEQSSEFLQIIESAQTSLNEQNKIVGNKVQKTETRPRTTSFGDKFKPAKGSWECKNCYIINDGKANFCIACETPKSGSTPKKTEESGPAFSFGNFTNASENIKPTSSLVFGQKPIASSWGSAFKPTEGSWECKTCYVRNDNEKDQCMSCMTSKTGIANDGTLQSDIKLTAMNLKQEVSKTSSVVGFGDAFKPKAGSWECKVCLIRNNSDVLYCVSCESPKDDSVPKKDISKGINLDTSGLKFNFGMQFATSKSSSFETNTSFSNLFNSSKNDSDTKLSSNRVSEETKFVFGSPQKHEFEFKPKSPKKSISGQGDEESDENYTDDEGDNIYFKPVIPLPDKVEVKTGEEDEDVLYCHRAKLFRFVSGEWKERGLGDIKILQRKDNGKLRVVMRREQVFKICLNHILTNNIEYIKKDEKSWLFHAADYSEGELVHEQYCLRFKFAEVAEEFRNAVKNALQGSVSEQQVTKKKIEEDLDDVELISETKVTAEEEKEALALGLPPKFFSYRQLPDCACDQCKKDDLYLKDLLSSNNEKSKDSSPKNIVFGGISSNTKQETSHSPMLGFNSVAQNRTKESCGVATNASAVSTSTFSFTGNQQTLKDLLVKPSILTSDDSKNISNSNAEKTDKPFSFSTAFSGNSKIFSTPSSSIFGSNTGGLFSNPPSSLNTSSTSFFGSKLGNIFGNTNNDANSSVTPIFGSAPKINDLNSSSSNIISSNSSIFSGSNSSESNSSISNPIFGSNALSNTFSTTNSSLSKSSGTTGTITGDNPIFKTSNVNFSFTEPKAVNNSSNNISFGNVSQNVNYSETKTTNLKEDDEIILKCNTDISFASLAAQVTPDAKPAFSKTGDSSFSFLGAGAPVFESAIKNPKKKSAANESHNESDDEAAEANAEEEYDPHYEPIVPLPDAITVSTGEEEETILFGERAKLFRYDADTKEWKERGVGQLKILYHPQQNTFRLLLRREQVHKVVLNQLIIPTLQLQPMMSSDKAWMWAGYNYTDDGNELEKLAVKFRNSETAIQFQKTFNECIVKVTDIQNNRSLNSAELNTGLEDISSDEQNTLDDPNNEDYEDEEEEEDDDDRSVMFIRRCTFSEQISNGLWNHITEGEGDLQVYYDPDLYASRISFNDDTGNILSNTLIGVNTVMNIEDNECTWRGVEWADGNTRWRTLKASFSNREDAEEFHASYLESLNYAHQIGVMDEIPTEADTETEE